MNSDFDLKAKFYQSQSNELERVEGKHDSEPPIQSILTAVTLSAIEAGAAFWLLLPSGLLIAAIGAALPVGLLWGIAYFYSERFELPEKYEQLMEEYNDSIQS